MVTRQLFTIAIFVVLLVARPAMAEFKYLESDPIGIPIKIPTAVTFITEIPTNPKLIKQSINLLRQTPQGLKVVGTLHDDGLLGDRLANDNLYSLQVTLDEIDAGQIVFQASAAYKGVLKRDLSTPYVLSVYPTAEQILYLTPPSHNPSALNFALNNLEDVTFSSRTTGTENPPAVLELWELDAKGQRINPALGQLRDDGQSGDLTAGDYLYSGTFPVSTGVEGEKRYQVTAVYQGAIVSSPVGALTITHHPIGPAAINPADAIQDPVTGQEFAPGELLVKFQTGLTPQQIDRVLQPLNARVIGSLPEIGVMEVQVQGAGDSNGLKQALAQIQALSQTAYAEPNGLLYLGAASPDKTCKNNTDTNCEWAAIKVRANEVWPVEGAGITVAVIDTGVDSSIDLPAGETILSGYNAEGGIGTADTTGHGSSVARLIAAKRNAKGITGIAPQAKILPIKAFQWGTAYYSHIATGIAYAWQPSTVQNPKEVAKVINVSAWDYGQDIPAASFNTIKDEVDKATKQNSLVVSIAGNTPNNTCQSYRLAKAIYDGGGLIVGGTTFTDSKWNSSGYGSCVEIAAPSENICSGVTDPSNPDSQCLVTASDGKSLRNGTSFAAPQVSGAAALLFSQNPNRTLADIKQRLKIFSKPLGDQFCPGQMGSGPCAGRLDVFSALVSGEILSGTLWTTPVLNTLDFPNSRSTSINALNNKGESVGSYLSESNTTHGLIYDGNEFLSVDFPGAHLTELTGINDSGQKTGYYALASNSPNHGFLYDGTHFTPFDITNSTSTVVTGINNSGQIVGHYSTNSSSGNRGFVLDGSTFTDINYPGATSTMVNGINNSGQLVGTYYLPNEDPSVVRHGFLYSGNTFINIDFPNAMRTEANGINDAGQIVGTYALAIGKDFGFIYNPSGVYTTKEGPTALYTSLKGINNFGQEVGWYFSGENFVQHGLGQQDENATDNASQASVQPNDVKAGTNAKFMWNPSDPLQTRFQIKLMVNCTPVSSDLPNMPYVELEAFVVADDYFEFWFNNNYKGNYLLEEHQSPIFPNQGIPSIFNITEFKNGENIIEIRANDGGCLLDNGKCPDRESSGFPYPRSFKAVFFDGLIKFGSSASSSPSPKCIFQNVNTPN